jgi:hypothetical protein
MKSEAPSRDKRSGNGTGGPDAETARPHQTDPRHRDQVNTHDLSGRGQQGASPEDDVRAYFDVLYGGATGFCHVAYGDGWLRNNKGTLVHRFWSETRERYAFAYPADADAAVAKVLELSARDVDVYVATALMRTPTSRSKTQVASLCCLHADLDHPGLDLDGVAQLGWCAIGSGTVGHHHLYVPLSEPVAEAAFGVLQDALVAKMEGDSKKAGNDVLRPPWTRNFKPTADGGDPVPVRWAVRP